MKSKKGWIAGGICILVLVIIMAAVSGGKQVEVVKAARGTLTLAVEETGYVEAKNQREVQAAQSARVVELLVDTGDLVKAGETLMVMMSPELMTESASARSQLSMTQSQLQAAELEAESLRSGLTQAQNDLARKKTLLESGALSQVDYEQAELQVTRLMKSLAQQEASVTGLNSQVASLNETLKILQEKTKELQVISPTAGTVLELPVKAGQVAAPGTLLVRVGSGNQIRTELLSDELRRVKTGQMVKITAPVLGEQILTGRVSKIYPQAYEKTSALGVIQRRVPVIIDLDQNGNLQPGYEVRVSIETVRKERVILLPRESVRLNQEGHYRALIVSEGRIKERPIQLGEKNQQWVEVWQGIKVGEIVVRDGSQELKAGSRVKPVMTNQKN